MSQNIPWSEQMVAAGSNLKAALMSVRPETAQAMLGGFLATVLGNLPDEFWERMKARAAEPCGEPDCDCEKMRVPVMEALELLRNDYKE